MFIKIGAKNGDFEQNIENLQKNRQFARCLKRFLQMERVQKCENLVDLETWVNMLKNAEKCVSGCKNRLRYRGERALRNLIQVV